MVEINSSNSFLLILLLKLRMIQFCREIVNNNNNYCNEWKIKNVKEDLKKVTHVLFKNIN